MIEYTGYCSEEKSNTFLKTKSFLLIIIISFCFVSSAVAGIKNSDGYPSTPEGVVQTYCKMDADGAGLNTESWLELQKLTTWPDGPGWDYAVVVRKFKVTKVGESKDRAQVKVEYDVVGGLSGDPFHLDTDKTDETLIFDLIKTGKVWKIERPQEPPHMSIETAIKRLEIESPERLEKGLIKYLRSLK